MGAYENPTYYGVTQDYTAFNKAMMGSFDRYMQMYMMQQKAQTPESDPNKDYYKLLEDIKKVPGYIDAAHVKIFGLDGTIREKLKTATVDEKRAIQSQIIAVSESYQFLNDYIENPELYKELDVQTRNLLNNLLNGDTKIKVYQDEDHSWGNIYFENDNWGGSNQKRSVVDIGNSLKSLKRDFSAEDNIGKTTVNNIIDVVEKRIENKQDRMSEDYSKGSVERNNIIKEAVDKLENDGFGENWGSFWHSMPPEAKVVPIEGEYVEAWDKVKTKWINKGFNIDSSIDESKNITRTIDLNPFGFTMTDFKQNNKVPPGMIKLRNKAIADYLKKEIDSRIAPDPWSPPGEDTSVRAIKEKDNAALTIQIKGISSAAQSQKPLGPVVGIDSSAATQLLEYLKASDSNKRFRMDGKFNNYRIMGPIIEGYVTGYEAENVAEKKFQEYYAQQYGRQYIDLPRDSDAKKDVDEKVATDLERFKNSRINNEVWRIRDGQPLDLGEFENSLRNDIMKNLDANLIAPSNEDDTIAMNVTNDGLPIILSLIHI